MKKSKTNFIKLLLLIILVILFAKTIPQANASVIDDIRNLLSKALSSKDLSLNSSMALAPNGDNDNNGEINSGDVVRFTYIISNSSEKKYSLTTLKTSIDRTSINFIHNIQGTSGLNDDGKTITVPNILIEKDSSIIISFDARLNFYDEASKYISIEPELVGNDKKTILKSSKKQINSKKSERQVPKMINNIKNK